MLEGNYLYDYYDRHLSHANMGYDYIAMGQGLEPEDIIPAQFLDSENPFPPSDRMMMEKIVPMFVNEEQLRNAYAPMLVVLLGIASSVTSIPPSPKICNFP